MDPIEALELRLRHFTQEELAAQIGVNESDLDLARLTRWVSARSRTPRLQPGWKPRDLEPHTRSARAQRPLNRQASSELSTGSRRSLTHFPLCPRGTADTRTSHKPTSPDMTLIEFPEVNVTYAKDQPQYCPLPAYRFNDSEGRILCCWRLSLWERICVLFSGRLWHQVLTFDEPLQPQLLTVQKPLT